MKIYVVTGEQGEYSDWTTWLVKAFMDQSAAESFELKCEKFAKHKIDTIRDWQKAHPAPTYGDPTYVEYHQTQQALIASFKENSPDPDMPDFMHGSYSTQEVELE